MFSPQSHIAKAKLAFPENVDSATTHTYSYMYKIYAAVAHTHDHNYVSYTLNTRGGSCTTRKLLSYIETV